MAEQLALHGTGVLYLVHYPHVHLLPEAGHGRHAGGVRLTHGLLDIQRMGVHYHGGTLGQCQDGPSTLKDMSVGQEIHDAVVLVHGYALAVGLKGSMELAVSQYDALRVARRTTGIQDVGNVVVRSLLLQPVHLRLARHVLAQLEEVAEVDGIGVVRRDVHGGVEDDDTLQRGAQRHGTAGFVVLLLFAHEEVAHLCVVHHKLYLLLRRGGIERDGDSADAPGTEVALKVLHRILREDTDVLLRLHAEVEQGVRHLHDSL